MHHNIGSSNSTNQLFEQMSQNMSNNSSGQHDFSNQNFLNYKYAILSPLPESQTKTYLQPKQNPQLTYTNNQQNTHPYNIPNHSKSNPGSTYCPINQQGKNQINQVGLESQLNCSEQDNYNHKTNDPSIQSNILQQNIFLQNLYMNNPQLLQQCALFWQQQQLLQQQLQEEQQYQLQQLILETKTYQYTFSENKQVYIRKLVQIQEFQQITSEIYSSEQQKQNQNERLYKSEITELPQFDMDTIQYVLYYQKKDKNSMKIICNETDIDEIIPNFVNSLSFSEQKIFNQQEINKQLQEETYRVIGFYGSYQASLQLINKLFPNLGMNKYINNNKFSPPKYDQIVAFKINEYLNQQKQQNKTFKNILILIYNENSEQTLNQKSSQTECNQQIRYILDTSHIFINVLSKSCLDQWENKYIKAKHSHNSNHIYKQIFDQRTNDKSFIYKKLNHKQQTDNKQLKWLITNSYKNRIYIIAQDQIKKDKLSKKQIEKINYERLDFMIYLEQIYENQISIIEKVELIKERFIIFMKKINLKLENSTQLDKLFQEKQNLFQEFKNKMQENQQELIKQSTLSFYKFILKKQIPSCCNIQNTVCLDNNCQSIQQIIKEGVELIEGKKILVGLNECSQSNISNYNNLQTNIHQNNQITNIIQDESTFIQNAGNTFQQDTILNNFDWILDTRKFQIVNYHKIIYEQFINNVKQELENDQKIEYKIKICEKANNLQIMFTQILEIANNLIVKSESLIQQFKDQFSLDSIFEEINNQQKQQQQQLSLKVYEVNLSSQLIQNISQENQILKLDLPIQIQKIQKYIVYNDTFDYIIAITNNLEENQIHNSQSNKENTEVWRINKINQNIQLVNDLVYNKTGLVIDTCLKAGKVAIINQEKNNIQIWNIDQQISQNIQYHLQERNNQINQNQELFSIKNIKKIFFKRPFITVYDDISDCLFDIDQQGKVQMQSYYSIQKDNSSQISNNSIEELNQDLRNSNIDQQKVKDVLYLYETNWYALIYQQQVKFIDENFTLIYTFEIQQSNSEIQDISMDISQNLIKLIILRKNQSIEIQYQDNDEVIPSQSIQQNKENAVINKVIDSISMFGINSYSGYGNQRKKIFYYYDNKTENFSRQKIKDYIDHKDLQFYLKNFFIEHEKQFTDQMPTENQILQTLNDINIEDQHKPEFLKFYLKTRVPFQISTFLNNNYQFLQNGLYGETEKLKEEISYQESQSIYEIKNNLKFGWYEKLLNLKSHQNVLILSIFGRQSIGKSTLYNYFFDSRFAVSESRCTEGVWMSMSQVDDDTFLILLDCEGLFSLNRKNDKGDEILLQQIMMVSDLSILFIDNGFENSQPLFELFKRIQKQAANRKEKSKYYKGDLIFFFKEREQEVQIRDQELFLSFSVKIHQIYQPRPRYNESQHDLQENRNEIIKIIKDKIKKNQIPDKFNYLSQLEFIKYSIFQLKFDDEQDIQLTEYQEKIEKYKLLFEKKFLQFNEQEQQNQYEAEYKDPQNQNKINKITIKQKDIILQQQKDNQYQNEDCINPNIIQFINIIPKEILQNTNNLKKFEYFKEFIINISKKTIQKRKDIIEEDIESLLIDDPKFQERNKYLKISMNNYYNNILYQIQICEQQCNECDKFCMKQKGHKNQHNCQTLHTHKSSCINSNRKKQIKESCNQKCQLEKCLNPCQNQNGIDHSGYHLCENTHFCFQKCQIGICEIDYKEQIHRQETIYGQILIYSDDNQISKNEKCRKIIKKGQIDHEGRHECLNPLHKCSSRCPECNALCQQDAQHEGLCFIDKHKSVNQIMYYMNQIQNEQLSDQNSIQIENQLSYGEKCDDFCKKMGRGHTHLIICEGDQKCAQRYQEIICENQGRVKHVEKIINNETLKFDQVPCHDYWKCNSFKHPLDNDNEECKEHHKQQNKCNWACLRPHQNNHIHFCSLDIWHPGKHEIDCGHDFSNKEIDICFTLDTTSSMKWVIEEVKLALKAIINSKYKDEYSIKVGILGYKDHNPQAKSYITNIYSELKDPDFTYLLIDKIQCCEGGDIPEAVYDGLNETVSEQMGWRAKSNKYIFHLFDAPPHGYEQYGFKSKNSDWSNNGCPCKLKIEDIAQKFKDMKINYYMFQCSNQLKKTKKVFKEIFQECFMGDYLICPDKNKSDIHNKIGDLMSDQICPKDPYQQYYQNNQSQILIIE